MSNLSHFALLLLLAASTAQAQGPTPIPTTTPCRNPMEGTAPNCVFIEDHHRCDVGNATIPASPVSTSVVGASDISKFLAVVNKKLACCMNDLNLPLISSYSKFDCVDNSSTKYNDFNALWGSITDEDPGMMNALYLTNGTGKPITGFYTLNGAHCDNLSEFLAPASGIQPYKIDPSLVSGQQLTVGGMVPAGNPYPIPMSASFSDLAAQLSLKGKKYPSPPTDIADALRCPILVRAAMVASCGTNPRLPIAQRTYSVPNGAGTKTRCTSAASIQVQIRIEQLFEMSGSPKMQTIDTVMSPNLTNSMSLERIISQKNGAACPFQTIPWNNLCRY